jgi:hypothetical protein
MRGKVGRERRHHFGVNTKKGTDQVFDLWHSWGVGALLHHPHPHFFPSSAQRILHDMDVCGLFLVAWLCPNCRRNNTDPAVWRNPLAPALPSEGGGEPKALGPSHWSSSVRSRCRPPAHWATGLRSVSEGSYLFVCCECVWCGVVWWAYCWLLTGQIGGPVAATSIPTHTRL